MRKYAILYDKDTDSWSAIYHDDYEYDSAGNAEWITESKGLEKHIASGYVANQNR